jgi:hypothetical protein
MIPMMGGEVSVVTQYWTLCTLLAVIPLLKARAFRTAVLVSLTGPEYKVELDVGSEPSVVYRISAPGVLLTIVISTEFMNEPLLGVK